MARCLSLLLLCSLGAGVSVAAESSGQTDFVLLVHGGAGTITPESLDAEREAAIRQALDEALEAGGRILADGGDSLDAVQAAVVVLEDSPWFNAGRGAVFTAEGRNELDASLMQGHTRRAGAVAGLRHVRNPIRLARAVLAHSPHVMLIGEGAEAFAREQGVELVEPEYFRTEERWQALQRAKQAEQAAAPLPPSAYFGTVGAVALDRHGHLAAATSTGGMTNKRWGRVGDSPIIGAGTWADERCAVSATGWGEFFIRLAVAHDICARVAYGGVALRTAAEEVTLRQVPALGGDGGVIAVDAEGNIALPFNTSGMYRGWLRGDGARGTAIFHEPAPTP
ncbi:MAG: isoaspartyl peptidase/L-asparaginase [Lysobacteraceae bacterium]